MSTRFLKHILEYGDFAGAPEQMSIDLDTRCSINSMTLTTLSKGMEIVHKADKFKLNIYFDLMKRGADIMNISAEIEMQRRTLQEMKDNGYPLDDDVTIKRFTIDYAPDTRLVKDFSLNEKKIVNARRTSGFYAIATLGMDMTAMQI